MAIALNKGAPCVPKDLELLAQYRGHLSAKGLDDAEREDSVATVMRFLAAACQAASLSGDMDLPRYR